MLKSSITSKLAFIWAMLLILGMPAVTMAQKMAKAPETGKPWLQWIVLVVAALATIAIAFKNAKRTHQD